jgi:hypothetical protein
VLPRIGYPALFPAPDTYSSRSGAEAEHLFCRKRSWWHLFQVCNGPEHGSRPVTYPSASYSRPVNMPALYA